MTKQNEEVKLFDGDALINELCAEIRLNSCDEHAAIAGDCYATMMKIGNIYTDKCKEARLSPENTNIAMRRILTTYLAMLNASTCDTATMAIDVSTQDARAIMLMTDKFRKMMQSAERPHLGLVQ